MNELIVRNPYTGLEVGRVPRQGREELKQAISNAKTAFSGWKNSSAFARAQLLSAAARELESRQEEFSQLIRAEAGKPITYARAETQRAIGVLQWAAAEILRYGGELLRLDTSASGRAGFGIHQRFPRGIVLGITPFNFPLNLVAHKVAPAIACGCPILIKPSPLTPLTAREFAKLFAGVPDLVQVTVIDDELAAELTRAPEIKTLSFTGSAKVGWQIRRQAPEKSTTLELGGAAWMILAEDTPRELMPAIARRVASAAFGFAGQSCISVQNVAAASAIHDEFSRHLQEATLAMPYGDPAHEKVVCGPVVHRGAFERIARQLSELPGDFLQCSSVERIGPAHPHELAPTLIFAPPETNTVWNNEAARSLIDEEVFGPVMTLARFEKMPELISRINGGHYGLQAGIFTQNWATIETLYRELEVGGLVVNDVPTTRYDHQPYGGVKDSGLGREGIRYAMDEMTEGKFLALSATVPV